MINLELTTDLAARGIQMEYVRPRTGERTLAIGDISLDIGRERFVSLVGPSGCGKTTFLKIANGLIEPTGGEVLLAGRPVHEAARERAMVFQDASLLPWFNVLRNVGYGLECRGVRVRDAAQRAQAYVALVGLDGFERHYPHELSGGMQQRVNLARALTVEPRVLLMDEPFAALDAQTREEMQEELLDIWRYSKKTVLFVTHQISEAIYLSDQVIVLSARPSRVLEIVDIGLERPRDIRVKRTPEFIQYEDHIWNLIRAESTSTRSSRRSTPADA